jgi:hypothetical protein
LANGTSQITYLAKHLDVSRYSGLDLVVRCTAKTIPNNGATLEVKVFLDGYTDELPSTTFYDTDSPMASTYWNYSTGNVPLVDASTKSTGTPLGAMIAVAVVATQGSSVTTFTATLGVDLVLRD